MQEKLAPSPKEKYHGTFAKYWYIFTSGVLSFIFVAVLFIFGTFHHVGKLFKGEKELSLPENEETSECFPNIKTIKFTNDLRYYALQLDLDLQEYNIETDDGYILILHRLINPQHSPETRNTMKPILLQHGLLGSGGTFLTPGLRSLPYYLLSNGYDVWLGNNRSGFKPLHATLQGNLMHNEEYWDWDIRDLAYYDLPCIINNVLSYKPLHEKLILMGHLQGSSQSFLLLKNPELAHMQEKIEWFVGLAPAIYPGVLFHKFNFIRFMGSRNRFTFKLIFGICAFLNPLVRMRNFLYSWVIFGKLATIMFNYLFNWDGHKWNKNKKVWHIHFIFNVSFVSSKLMTWWTSPWREDSFRNQLVLKDSFKHGKNHEILDDEQYNVDDNLTFFPYKEQWFNNNIVPMIIFNGDVDNLVDSHRLKTHMENFENGYKVGENLHIFQVKEYSHLDVIWGDDVIDQIGQHLVGIIKDMV